VYIYKYNPQSIFKKKVYFPSFVFEPSTTTQTSFEGIVVVVVSGTEVSSSLSLEVIQTPVQIVSNKRPRLTLDSPTLTALHPSRNLPLCF
jgi:hypothetical protein